MKLLTLIFLMILVSCINDPNDGESGKFEHSTKYVCREGAPYEQIIDPGFTPSDYRCEKLLRWIDGYDTSTVFSAICPDFTPGVGWKVPCNDSVLQVEFFFNE